ncbi:MAG: D-alanine--D-alanine ligase, partial [Actinobacteria bacterium]
EVHTLLGCRDVSRVDMVVAADGTPYVLECNTSPGMTETSLLPMAAESAGMSFQDVVSQIVRAALARASVSGT